MGADARDTRMAVESREVMALIADVERDMMAGGNSETAVKKRKTEGSLGAASGREGRSGSFTAEDFELMWERGKVE